MKSATKNDPTGRRQMAGNLVASWATQLIFIAAGFVLPHLINRSLGQARLGVWDFSWSLVSYFSLVQSGIVASVSRYVAGFLAVGETENLNRAVSTAFALLLTAGSLVTLATLIAFGALGTGRHPELGEYASEARLVVLILGIEIAVSTALSAFGGVITGHHNWTIHYAVQTIGYAAGVAGMIAALLAGGGLAWVALAHFGGETGAALARIVIAYRICPTLRVGPRFVDRPMAGSMLRWGAKILIPTGGEMLFNQSINLLVLGAMGPAALAVFARSSTLSRQIKSLVGKASGILAPTASAMQATDDLKGIQSMALKCGWWTALFSYPFLVFFIIQGGPLVALWMGAGFRNDLLVAILTAGSWGLIVEYPVLGMLAGLNIHGRSGLAHLLGGVVSVGLAWLALRLGMGMLGAAVAFSVPQTAVYLVYIPWYIARHLKFPVSTYVKTVFIAPLGYVLPFGIVQVICVMCWPHQPVLSVLIGLAAGAAALVPVYWFWALPEDLKLKIKSQLSRFGIAGSSRPALVQRVDALASPKEK